MGLLEELQKRPLTAREMDERKELERIRTMRHSKVWAMQELARMFSKKKPPEGHSKP